jgi:hypothetical protein
MSDHGSRSAAGREPLDAESADAANVYAAKKRADAHQLADVAVTSSLRCWSSPLKSGAVDRAQELVAVHLLAALDRLLNDVPLRPRHPSRHARTGSDLLAQRRRSARLRRGPLSRRQVTRSSRGDERARRLSRPSHPPAEQS